ncbi:Hypothetical protein, putative [Bodo saltans]|uniref:Uncharacterized protein n=1 Tax=Bodo saltans TaxID=75058 RepID=A0A0S4KLI1_BODSA|nr:Hypothetical protein, putative [Bodo saltans]|eukprot:CUI15352.1 Hypothetical protein, putative [Bodo saltans]
MDHRHAARHAATDWLGGIDVPDHLRYREPKSGPDYYVGVLPRYLSPPKKRVDVDPLEEARRKAAAQRVVNPQFSMVESRYRSPPKSQVPARVAAEEEPLPKYISVRPTTEYVAHKRQAAVFQHIPSKYYDMYVTQGHGGPTPRDQVAQKQRQQRIELSKEGRTFSPILSKPKAPTFGAPDPLPGKKKTGQSVVMEWVKHGIPIPTSRHEEPVKPRTVSRGTPFFGPGGAGGGSYFRRETSPTRLAAQQEERIVSNIKERLQHPKATPESIRRLSQPRTTSPNRTTSPVRGGTPNRTTSPNRNGIATTRPQAAAAAASARPATSQQPTMTLRTISPRREVRPVNSSPTHVLTAGQPGGILRRPLSPTARTTSPVRVVSPAQSNASPSITTRRRAPDSPQNLFGSDVDVQISVMTEASELTDTPHIRPQYATTHHNSQGQRQTVLFQSPPHLASP